MNLFATFNPLGWIEWPWWTMWAVYGGLGLIALIALGAVKSIAGWPGVIAVILFVVAVGSAALGFKQGVAWAERKHPKDAPQVRDIFGGLFGRKK